MRASCVGGLCKRSLPGRMSTTAEDKKEMLWFSVSTLKTMFGKSFGKGQVIVGGQGRKRKRVDEVRDRHRGHAHS